MCVWHTNVNKWHVRQNAYERRENEGVWPVAEYSIYISETKSHSHGILAYQKHDIEWHKMCRYWFWNHQLTGNDISQVVIVLEDCTSNDFLITRRESVWVRDEEEITDNGFLCEFEQVFLITVVIWFIFGHHQNAVDLMHFSLNVKQYSSITFCDSVFG